MKETISDRLSLLPSRLTNNGESSHQGSTRRRSRRSSNMSRCGEKIVSLRAILEILRESRQDSDGVLDIATSPWPAHSHGANLLSPRASLGEHSSGSPSLVTEAALSIEKAKELPGGHNQTIESGLLSSRTQQFGSDAAFSPASSDLKSRNFNHFQALLEQESQAKQAEEAALSTLEREERAAAEQERLSHERRKLAHYTKLGGTFKVTTDLFRPASPRAAGTGANTAGSPVGSTRRASDTFLINTNEGKVNSPHANEARNSISYIDTHQLQCLSLSPVQPPLGTSSSGTCDQKAGHTPFSTSTCCDDNNSSTYLQFHQLLTSVYPPRTFTDSSPISVAIPSSVHKTYLETLATPPHTPPPPSPMVTILSEPPNPNVSHSRSQVSKPPPPPPRLRPW